MSFTEGTFWKLEGEGGFGSYTRLVAETPGLIAIAAGTVATPCATTVSVAGRGDALGVVCATHFVHRSQNGGTTWDEGVEVPGAAVLAATGGSYRVASVGQEDCAGVALTPLASQFDGSDPEAIGCFQGEFSNDNLAIAFAADTLWLWAGNTVITSADKGVTWR